MADETLDRPAATWVGILSCLVCGKQAEYRPTDLLGFAGSKWPRCCGQVMALHTPGDPSAARPLAS